MRSAIIELHGIPAAVFTEGERGNRYSVTYLPGYRGEPVSLTMPLQSEPYRFETFPPFLDGLLPEGMMLEALLRTAKIDRDDLFSQILTVGADLVGAVTVVPYQKDTRP